MMSTLETSALAVGVVCLGVFLYIHIKVIPDLVKNDTDDKAGNKKKMMYYSLANAVLFVVILICALIFGTSTFCYSNSDKVMALSVGVVCLGVFLYIHFLAIPGLVKTDNKKKMTTYSWVNAVLFVVILICAVILGATISCSSGSDKGSLSFGRF